MEATTLALKREVSGVRVELEVLSRRIGDLEGQPRLVDLEERLELLEAKTEALMEVVRRCATSCSVRRDLLSEGTSGA